MNKFKEPSSTNSSITNNYQKYVRVIPQIMRGRHSLLNMVIATGALHVWYVRYICFDYSWYCYCYTCSQFFLANLCSLCGICNLLTALGIFTIRRVLNYTRGHQDSHAIYYYIFLPLACRSQCNKNFMTRASQTFIRL